MEFTLLPPFFTTSSAPDPLSIVQLLLSPVSKSPFATLSVSTQLSAAFAVISEAPDPKICPTISAPARTAQPICFTILFLLIYALLISIITQTHPNALRAASALSQGFLLAIIMLINSCATVCPHIDILTYLSSGYHVACRQCF